MQWQDVPVLQAWGSQQPLPAAFNFPDAREEHQDARRCAAGTPLRLQVLELFLDSTKNMLFLGLPLTLRTVACLDGVGAAFAGQALSIIQL